MRGMTLAEVLVAVVLALMSLAVAVPCFAYLRDEGRAAAGARQMAATFSALRFQAVARGKAAGLLFEPREGGWVWWEVSDGNGNGLRTSEVRSGVDPIRSGPFRLEDRVESVRLGFPSGSAIPQIPPQSGTIDDLLDPVQFGRSDLVSFTPGGTASSGTLYLTDGRSVLYGVVLYGPTSRVRVWRYDTRRRQWTL